MKRIAEDKALMLEFIFRVQRAHEILTLLKDGASELRYVLKDIEELGITLEGCEVDGFVVGEKVTQEFAEDDGTLYIPSWTVACNVCGKQSVVKHTEILEQKITKCGHEGGNE